LILLLSSLELLKFVSNDLLVFFLLGFSFLNKVLSLLFDLFSILNICDNLFVDFNLFLRLVLKNVQLAFNFLDLDLLEANGEGVLWVKITKVQFDLVHLVFQLRELFLVDQNLRSIAST